MTNQERVKKYVKEECPNCKHREEFLCDIRVIKCQDCIKAQCIYYKREKPQDEVQAYEK